jgi:hypothetical protein
MIDSLKKALNAVKEGAVEAGAKTYLNKKIQKFGTITHMEIDMQQKNALLEAALKGEPGPVTVRIHNYCLTKIGPKDYISAQRFESSREWVAEVLNEYVAGRQFQISSTLASVLT